MDASSAQQLLFSLQQAGQHATARDVLDFIARSGAAPDPAVFRVLVAFCETTGDWQKAMELVQVRYRFSDDVPVLQRRVVAPEVQPRKSFTQSTSSLPMPLHCGTRAFFEHLAKQACEALDACMALQHPQRWFSCCDVL